MDRALVLDREGMNRTIILKQLSLMGLKTHMADRLEDIGELRPCANDVVFVGADIEGGPETALKALTTEHKPAATILMADR